MSDNLAPIVLIGYAIIITGSIAFHAYTGIKWKAEKKDLPIKRTLSNDLENLKNHNIYKFYFTPKISPN